MIWSFKSYIQDEQMTNVGTIQSIDVKPDSERDVTQDNFR